MPAIEVSRSACEPERLATSAGLAVDVLLLELDGLLREIDQLGERGEIAFEVVVIGANGFELALRLAHGELERHRIDFEQHVAGRHVLALLHRDADDLAGNVRRDQHLLRADVGVVGRDVAAAHQVDRKPGERHDERRDHQQDEPQPLAQHADERVLARNQRRRIRGEFEDGGSGGVSHRSVPVSRGRPPFAGWPGADFL